MTTPILYLDHTAKMGGGEIALLNMVCALDRTRYEPVVVLASDGPLVARLRAEGVETYVMPLDPKVVDTRKDSLGAGSLMKARLAAACFGYAVRLAAWARRRGARLLHTNSLKSDLYGGLAGRLAGIPTIWHVRDGIDGDYLPPAVAAAFRRLARVVPALVIANSASTLRRLESPRHGAVVYSGFAGPTDNAQVVHDGYDARTFLEKGGLPFAPVTGPVVSLVGRIAAWKGQHVFLRAAAHVAARFPQAQFWVVGAPLFGEHDYEASLPALADELGIADRVTFWGFRDDVPDLMARTDVLVHASTLGEPFGQVVIEGMAAGKPVVATDGGAVPEIVLPGETGLLVPMGEDAPMADAIAALLADPARARALGASGRRRVQERFTIGHTARKVEAIYDHLLGGRRAPGRMARFLQRSQERVGNDLPRDRPAPMTTAVSQKQYQRGASLVSRNVGAETVLVPVRRSVGELEDIFTLNDVATSLWGLLGTPQSITSLVNAVVAEYDVEPPQAEADVLAFLSEMAAMQLVEVRDHA